MIASAAKGGGTKTSEASAPVASTASRTVLNTGRPRWVAPPLPGVTPPTTLVPWSIMSCGVEGADAAGDALHDDRGLLVDEDGHVRSSLGSEFAGRAATAFSAASASVSALIIGRPDVRMMRRPSSTLVPARRTTTGIGQAELAVGLHHALRDPVAAVDAGEDVDEDHLTLLVGQHGAEGLGDAFGRGAAADVEEVGRLAARPA